MKTCPKCKKPRRASSFGTRMKRGKPYLNAYCRECMNKYHVERRRKSPEVRKKHNAAIKRCRDKLLEEVQAYKTNKPCADCEQEWNYWQLQFDHLPERGVKVECVSNLIHGGSPEKVWREIAKCEVVCANCHANHTHFREHGALAQEESISFAMRRSRVRLP